VLTEIFPWFLVFMIIKITKIEAYINCIEHKRKNFLIELNSGFFVAVLIPTAWASPKSRCVRPPPPPQLREVSVTKTSLEGDEDFRRLRPRAPKALELRWLFIFVPNWDSDVLVAFSHDPGGRYNCKIYALTSFFAENNLVGLITYHDIDIMFQISAGIHITHFS